MPLFVDGTEVEKLEDLTSIFGSSSNLQNQKNDLKNASLKIVKENDFYLYVGQSEFATIKPSSGVKIIGSDEATTCHILILRHSGSGVISLGHLDGSFRFTFLKAMMKSLLELSKGSPEGRLEMHLIGGFLDERGLSDKLRTDIIQSVISLKQTVHLLTYCTGNDNDFIKDQVHFPILTGIGVNVDTGNIFPAEFTTKGPDEAIRTAGNFTVKDEKAKNIFKNGCIEIGPFSWNADWFERWIVEESDQYVRENFSTSPEQESKYFADHMRSAFKVMLDNPNPEETLFKGGKARVYRLSCDTGCWERVDREGGDE